MGLWPWACACPHFISILTRSNSKCTIVLALWGSAWPIGLTEGVDVGSHGLCQVTPSSRIQLIGLMVMVLEVPVDLVSDYLSRLIFAAPSSMLPILSCTEL